MSKLIKEKSIKKLICLAAIVGIISFIPTPPIGQSAVADVSKTVNSSQIKTEQSTVPKTTPVAAVQAPAAVETVQSTTPAPTPVVATPTYPTDGIAIMQAAGISESDYGYVSYIIGREGGWCATRWQGQPSCTGSYDPDYNSLSNPYEGYGLCQSTPGNKMASAGDDYVTNPVTQMKWCDSYAQARYGSWYNAYLHWINNHNW